MITLTTQAGIAASGNAPLVVPAHAEVLVGGIFMLNVTSAAVGVGDTLDVYLQDAIDGATWDDFLRFTQVLGNGGAKKYAAQWLQTITPTDGIHAPQDAAIAAGIKHGPRGGTWRVKWVVAGGTALFSFSLGFQSFARRP